MTSWTANSRKRQVRESAEKFDLSVVYATRDDSYGDANERLIKSIQRLKRIAKVISINLECVVVDWNSEEGRSMEQFLRKRKVSGVHVVVVDRVAASELTTRTGRPFVEYAAKNVGLSFARGRQVLVANSDIRISSRALRACVQRPYLDESFLRVDRVDTRSFLFGFRRAFQSNIRHGLLPSDEISIAVRGGVLRRVARSHQLPGEEVVKSFFIGPKGGIRDHFLRGLHTNASGDFICAPRQGWKDAGFFDNERHLTTMGDAWMCARLMAVGLRQVILAGSRHALHPDHPRENHASSDWNELDWPQFLEELTDLVDYPSVAEGNEIESQSTWI